MLPLPAGHQQELMGVKNQCIVTAATATVNYCQWCSVQSPTGDGRSCCQSESKTT